jgi:Ribonuclease toxin, BrnT, of type II toxin-antitoxin system
MRSRPDWANPMISRKQPTRPGLPRGGALAACPCTQPPQCHRPIVHWNAKIWLRTAEVQYRQSVYLFFTSIAHHRRPAEGGKMQITWREEKRRLNVRKHGLDFTLVRDIVSDPLAVTVFDRVEDGEERWHTIGVILTGASSNSHSDIPGRHQGVGAALSSQRLAGCSRQPVTVAGSRPAAAVMNHGARGGPGVRGAVLTKRRRPSFNRLALKFSSNPPRNCSDADRPEAGPREPAGCVRLT